MSTLNKYIVYKCSICQRQTEILLDARRPDPSRCNITLHCRGFLSKVGERSNKGFLFTPLVSGLDDYIPRGQSTTVIPTVTPPNPISIYTGNGVMTAAVFRRDVDPSSRQVTFWVQDINGRRFNVETPNTFNASSPVNSSMILSLYEITPALLRFKRYIFNVTSGDQLIRGIDNSPDGLNLRFDSTNAIKLILNGIDLSPDNYDASISNQITMTPVITIQNSILEVLVWDEIPAIVPTDEFITLNFGPLGSSSTDLSFRDLSCWGDYSCVDFSQIYDTEGVRTLLYCLDTTELDITKTYGIAKADILSPDGTLQQINPSEFYLMLGKEPFLFQDKELNAFILGSKFLDQTTSLNFQQSIFTGNYELIVDQSLITQKYNPIIPTLPVSNTVSQVTAVTQTINGTEDLKRKYILGPS
jgi:hypothetical protein